MEELLNQVLSALLNSKNINQLPVATRAPVNGKFVFYNPTTQRAESITYTNFKNTANKFSFVATDNQTSFPTELTGASFAMVYSGRTHLIEGTDYTFTASGVVVLNTGAIVGQTITVITY